MSEPTPNEQHAAKVAELAERITNRITVVHIPGFGDVRKLVLDAGTPREAVLGKVWYDSMRSRNEPTPAMPFLFSSELAYVPRKGRCKSPDGLPAFFARRMADFAMHLVYGP